MAVTARDGTRWVYSPEFDEWTGWQPGEDGVWNMSSTDFARLYPEVVAGRSGWGAMPGPPPRWPDCEPPL